MKQQKLPAHITITKTGKYRVRYQKSSKFPIPYDEIFDTEDAAIEANEKYLAKNTLNLHDEIKHIGFCDACDEFLEWYRTKPKKPAPATIVSYKNYIKTLKIAIGNVDITKMDSLFITKILDKESKRQKRGNGKQQGGLITANTLHHEYSLLSILFGRFKKFGWIKINPMEQLEEPQFDTKPIEVPEFEELGEIEAKIMTAPIRERLQFLYGLYTGMREEEVAGQHIERDIDYDRMEVYVNTVIVKDENGKWQETGPKSKDSVRSIPVPENFFKVYNEYLIYRQNYINYLKIKNPDYQEIPNLFLNKDGDFYRPVRISRTWGNFRRKENIDININFHGLRHYYLTNQMNYNDGLTERDVQQLAGHADLRTTRRYVHPSKKKINKNATDIFKKFSKDSLFKDGYNVLTIPIEHIASIILGKAELSKIDDLKITLEVISNEKVDYFNISNVIEKSKAYIISCLPSLESLEVFKYDNLSNDELIDKIRKRFGKEIQIEVK